MDENALQQVFEELFKSLEESESQSGAILQFLKAKGIATDKELTPYIDQASKSSSVRWVAARARINRLVAAAMKSPEKSAQEKPETEKPKETPEQDSKKPAEQKAEAAPGAPSKEDTGKNAEKQKANGQDRKTVDNATNKDTQQNPATPATKAEVKPPDNNAASENSSTQTEHRQP
jgi:hypothetical protein